MGYKIKKIYQGTNLVRPYKYPYKPTSNTLIYMPLDGDLYKSGTASSTAVLGNNASWGTILGELQGLKLSGQANSNLKISGIPELKTFTLNLWVYMNDVNQDRMFIKRYNGASSNKALQFGERYNPGKKLMFNFFGNDQYSSSVMSSGIWYNVGGTYNDTTKDKKIYINGVNVGSMSATGTPDFGTNNDIYIGSNEDGTTSLFYGLMSNLIIEDKEWSATDVSNYYNSTKSKYGL